MNRNRPFIQGYSLPVAGILVVAFALVGMASSGAAKQKGFASPEEAVKAFAAAIKSDNDKELLSIFGPDANKLIFSGDPVGDRQRRVKFIKAFDAKNRTDQEGQMMVLIVGEKDWPFPIPIVKKGNKWFFDTKAGEEEILDRRIGENELDTIQTMLAVVDAEREYAREDRNNSGVLEYAGKFLSDPGEKNGLYWKTKEDEQESPLGELVADARTEGYARSGSKHEPIPYHGYYFRMLRKQGKHATGGAYDYVVNGKQIGGFAVVAYPAKYGNSGVMTFIVNHDGVVYEKNLGKNTASAAKAMKAFDPDKTWKKVEKSSGQ